MKIDVALNERVLVHENGRPTRYLAPGRHRIWAPFAPGPGRTVSR